GAPAAGPPSRPIVRPPLWPAARPPPDPAPSLPAPASTAASTPRVDGAAGRAPVDAPAAVRRRRAGDRDPRAPPSSVSVPHDIATAGHARGGPAMVPGTRRGPVAHRDRVPERSAASSPGLRRDRSAAGSLGDAPSSARAGAGLLGLRDSLQRPDSQRNRRVLRPGSLLGLRLPGSLRRAPRALRA